MVDDTIKLKDSLKKERDTEAVLCEIDKPNAKEHKARVEALDKQIAEIDKTLLNSARAAIENPDRLRVFGLKYIEGLTYYTISRKVGLSDRAVQRQVKKALEAIRADEALG